MLGIYLNDEFIFSNYLPSQIDKNFNLTQIDIQNHMFDENEKNDLYNFGSLLIGFAFWMYFRVQ